HTTYNGGAQAERRRRREWSRWCHFRWENHGRHGVRASIRRRNRRAILTDAGLQPYR
ncbi:hypothetical protein U1Q18_025395, partial [Sarracenia purpurea var. burkii]